MTNDDAVKAIEALIESAGGEFEIRRRNPCGYQSSWSAELFFGYVRIGADGEALPAAVESLLGKIRDCEHLPPHVRSRADNLLVATEPSEPPTFQALGGPGV